MNAFGASRRGGQAAVLLAGAILITACTTNQGATTASAGPASPAATPLPSAAEPSMAAYPTGDIAIMAPADPGGGWDSTARAMQAALDADVVETSVEVYNVGGAGGTIGLAEFVETKKADPHQLMVMGLVMVGAIRTNDAPVDLTQVTPIARLTGEYEALAVKADSKYQTLDDLIVDFKANPQSISWAGGSAGGTDHILVGLIAKAAGVDPSGINYIAHSGGGEALAAILSGAATVGVSGASEFADQVEAGAMRFLAISSDEPVEGIDAPTIKDSDLDVSLSNWRGVVAAPEITEAESAAVVDTITKMHDGPAWQAALESNGWDDLFLAGPEFDTFLADEQARVEGILKDIGLID
jgi:putative tricarboxylic transport membrane protein